MKIRVLVVDDDEDLLFLAGKFLAKEDDRFELVSANTDQEALQKLEEEEFDAIVCDHHLGPHSMTGLDLLEWVREGNPNIPFIIFTGRSQEMVAIRALNLGADYYLKKGTEEVQDLFEDIAHRIITGVESRRTEEALSNAYEELENKVKERTEELQKMNEQLVNEISERKKIEDALILQRELSNILCKTENLNDALDIILKTAVRMDGVDCGGIYLVDSGTGKFDLSSSKGISAHFLSKFSSDKGPADIRNPLYLSSNQIQSSEVVEDQYKDLTAVAMVPVQIEDETIAVLSLGSHTHKEIPIRDRHTLEAIVILIAAYMTRVKAEQSIIENQLEITNVFNSLNDIFIVANSKLKILSANTIALDYLGLTKEKLKEKVIGDIYSIKIDEWNNLLSSARSGEIIHLDNEIKGKDGKALQANTRVVAGKRNDEDILYFVSRFTYVQ